MNAAGTQAQDGQISALLETIAKGDASALLALYDRTGARLFELMTRVPADKEAAEAALLDTYTQLWRQAGAWIESPSFLRLVSHIEEIIDRTESGDPAIRPPDYVRDMLATRIEREPQRPVEKGAAPAAGGDVRLFHSLKTAPAAPAQSRRWTIFLWVITAGSVLLAIVAGHQWMQAKRFLDSSILRQKESEASAQKERESLRAELDKSRPSDQKIGRINEFLSSRGSRVVGLAPQSPDANISQVAILDTSHNQCLIAGHIRPAPEGMAYQVWFVTLTAYVSAGLVKPDTSDLNFDVLTIDRGLQKINSIMITLEPKGGSKQPTMPPLVFGRVG